MSDDDWHFFIGHAYDGKHIIEHIPCLTLEKWEDMRSRVNKINVTILEKDVTCQECLEWLHA